MLFLDPSADLALSIVGWTPRLQAKRKRLTPQEAQAFEVAAHQAAPSPLNDKPEPTPEEAKANRYAVGHVDFQGIAIAIECPRGSYRRGVDPDGHAWACRMPHHYGFVEATHGADGEGVDVFIGQNLDSDLVVIVNQVDPKTGAFDEHKVMLGFDSEAEARDAYLQAYEPGWKGLGSTLECTVEDFHTWLLDGDLEAPARCIQKAGFAEPEGDGTRWITVHPNGKDEPGHAVRIRPVAGKHGVFHVVGGANNKLNGLRLQDIKSPEHYRTEAKAKAKERRKAEKERLAKMTPQERQAHKENKQAAQGSVKEAEQKLIDATMRAKGVDPAQAQLPGTADGLAQHKHRQSLLSDALKTAKDAEKRLLMDAEARAAAGLATVGGDTQLRPEDVLTTPQDEEKGPGYVRALKERAKEAGLTAQTLTEKVQDLRERTAEIRASEGRFTDRHEKLGNGDVVAGILKAGELMGEAQREAHQQARALKESHGAAVKEALQTGIAENDSLREILQARAELQAARKAAKQGKPDTFQKAYQISTEEIADQVIQDAEEAMLSNRMVDFLDEVERAHPDSETLDAQDLSPEDGLHASKSAGAWDALHEIGLGILGQGFLDRDAVEVLGPDGAAVLAARTLRTAYTPDEQKEILQALEEIHLEEQATETPKAMEEAERLRSEAAKEDVKLHQDAHDLAAAAQIQKNKVDMLREARRILGSTLGRMEARAALIMALKEAPKQVLTVPLGKISNQNAVMTAAALGLKDGEYSLEMDGGEALLTLKPAGMDRLIAPVDHAAIHERDLAVAIKRGQLDETGFLPRGFARRTALATDDPLQSPPELQRPLAQLDHGASATDIQQAMEDYVGLRLAEGHRPADVMASMTALDFLEHHFPGKGLEAQGILQKVFPLQTYKTDKAGNIIYATKNGEMTASAKDEIERVTANTDLSDEAKAARIENIQGNKDSYEQIPTDTPLIQNRSFEDLTDHLQGITARAMERAGISQEQTLHGQRLDLDHPDFSEALHQTLASDPRLQSAFIAPGDLTGDQRKHLREYFRQEIAPRMTWGDTPETPEQQPEPEQKEETQPEKRLVFGQDGADEAPDEDGYRRLSLPKDETKAQEMIQAEAERMAGPKPEQFAASMFGDEEETQEYGEWKQRADHHAEEIRKRARIKGDDAKAAEAQGLQDEVRENLKAKQGGELTDEQMEATKARAKGASFENLWASYVEKMGGLTPATQALQDHMASRFLDTFKGHYERRTGQPLRTGIVKVRHADGFLGATGTQDERDEDRSERASQDAKMRKRTGGKFASGGIADIRDERARQGEASQASTAALLDTSDYTEAPKGPKSPGHTERWSLGTTAENQLRQVMQGAAKALQGQSRAFEMKPISMDGKYAAQQRAVKAITQLRKIGLFYGAGSGKSGIMLGAHAELHHAGKVKKAIYAVPSAVQAQFGGEAARFLDPKSGIYIHAKPGESFTERLEAYRHPDIHGIVVTHQALRDDCMKVLGTHLGKKPEDVKAFVHGAGRKELAQTLKAAWADHGVEHQALMMDEGHNALNRAGKQDSTLAKLMDAMGDNATYYAGATADPLKNDPSEAYDWLAKMDPDRYPAEGRAEFIRRYGKNTATTRRALKAELARYYFAERVDPSRAKADGSGMTQLTHAVHTAEVTPGQRKQLDAVDTAMARLRTAGSLADAAPHAKVISPGSFKEGMTPEEEAQAVEKVRSAAGTMREGAYNRILNYDPKGGKVQATVQLAKASHEAGEPPIVFARNHAAVEAIRQELEAQGLTVVTLTGKHNAREKADRIRAFQPADKGTAPTAHVLVMTDAGATGINIQRGRHVIHHDIPMTHMIHSQRAARAWRLGQTHDVRHTTVAADHGFDHQNLRRLKFKEGLAGILKSPDGFLDDTGTTERLRAIRERAGQTRFTAA